MMKDKIRIQRDMAISSINESKNLSAEDKLYLVELVTEAAEGTNGLDEKDKLQNVSETTFNLALLMTRLDDKINTLPEIKSAVESLTSQISKNQVTETTSQTWSDVAKTALLKPWPYVAVAIAVFSPYFVEIVNVIKSLFS